MTHTPHELAQNFPKAVDKIHELKNVEPAFRAPSDELSTDVNRHTTGREAASKPAKRNAMRQSAASGGSFSRNLNSKRDAGKA